MTRFRLKWTTRRLRVVIAACGLTVTLAVACARVPRHLPPPAGSSAVVAQVADVGKVVRSRGGMVVSGSPLASRAGLRMLQRGGNAVDAAVATAFALAVVEPSMSGLGGRTQMIVRTQKGEIIGLDGTTQVPSGYRPGSQERVASGYVTIATPGSVLTLTTVLHDYGTLPLAEVMAPAIEMAEAGVPTSAEQVRFVKQSEEQLRKYPGSRQYFLKPDGSLYQEGELFVQADLARTLRAIAAGGPDVFYRGEIAGRITADMAANGGFLTAADLASYQVERARLVRGHYRGYELDGTYRPAAGAITIEILQILEHFDLSAMPPAAWAAVVGQAIRLGFEDFDNMVKDPGNPEEAIRQMLSKERAKAKADKIRLPKKPSSSSGATVGRVIDTEVRDPEIVEHTTHLTVADGYGGIVSSTQSLGPAMGSKVATPGLGFLWASTMAYLAASKPGERSASGISPLIVFRDGQPAYVAGAAGGSTIVMALVEILSRALDQGLPLPEAVAAPRFSLPQAVPPAPGSGLEADALTMEVGDGAAWTPDQLEQLRSWGFKVTPSRTALFGIFHGIYVDRATGQFEGVADPRWGGVVAALRR